MIHEEKYAWGDAFPYNNTAFRNIERYGSRVQKIALHAFLNCPNRDGKLGFGGCTFCNNDSFVPSYAKNIKSIHSQIDNGLEFIKRRYPRAKIFVGYFQAYSNTYGDINYLKELYLEALSHPQISGITIGTRPDCVSDELLDFLSELSKDKIINIEYGVECSDDSILTKINRGHTYAQSVEAIEKTSAKGLETTAHFIFGLEKDIDKMLLEADKINKLPIKSLKMHQLQIVKGTAMAKDYKNGICDCRLFEKQEYIDFVINFLERLRPDISIERFVSEVPPLLRIAPDWGTTRVKEFQDILISEMKKRNSFQSKLFQS